MMLSSRLDDPHHTRLLRGPASNGSLQSIYLLDSLRESYHRRLGSVKVDRESRGASTLHTLMSDICRGLYYHIIMREVHTAKSRESEAQGAEQSEGHI